LSIIVPITMALNFMTGSKRLTVMPAVMCVLTWVILERRIRMRWVVAGFLAIVLIYPVARFWREDVLLMNTLTIGHVLQDPLPALSRTSNFLSSGQMSDYLVYGLEMTGRRFDAIGVTSVIVRDTPSISPFQNGRTLALIPIAYIPRALWPGKPVITIGRWVSDAYVPQGYLLDTNLGPTWVGEFYLNRGVPVVVIGMIVMGMLLKLAHEILLRPNPSIPIIAAAAIVMSTASLALQGGVVMATNEPIFMLFPLALVHILVRSFGGTRRMINTPEKSSTLTA
jgi:hypothetical protein